MEDLEAIKAELAATPWCARLLGEQDAVVELPMGRRIKATREDSLIAQTLNTKDTIARYVTVYSRPTETGAPIEEIKCIITLGGGVCGFPGVAHGGMVAIILDEILGTLIDVNTRHRAIERTPWMTAYLNTMFVNPVKVPGTVLAVARIVRLEGRKLYLDAMIEDGEGEVLAKADGMFVALRRRL